ncbi:MAG: endonuclease/exonuclease/phosphatase family protein [Bacteroidales bacterium]
MKRIIRFILVCVTICMSLALVLSYFTYYVNPADVWYIEVWALGYPVYLFGTSVLLVYWLFSETKKYILIPLISLLFGFSTHSDVVSLSTSNDDEDYADTLSVMSYNVQAFNWLGWRQRSDVQQGVCDYLYEKQADIICFQEFHHDIQEPFVVIDSLKKYAGIINIAAHKFHSIPGRYFYGNVICSQYPIIAEGVLHFQYTGNSCLWADIALQSDTIRVCNVHLESYRFSPDDIKTIQEMSFFHIQDPQQYESIVERVSHAVYMRGQQTDELIRFISNSPYKVVLAGDFNTPPYSYTYKHLKKAGDFSDVFLSAGNGIGGTLNWNLPSVRLDYILYPSDWTCHTYESRKLLLSDHFPVFSGFSLKN